jgi:D-amino-acid dehydrogenase
VGKTVVIGAGVIGLACAYELLKRGRDVMVVDAGAAGQACSAGNAGWVVPSMSAPIPAPGLVATSLRWMLKRDSPLYIRPRLDPAFSTWLWQFWRNCRPEPYEAGLEAVMALNRETLSLFDSWHDEGLVFEMNRTGLLFVGLHDAAVDHALAEIDLLVPYGYAKVERLDTSALRDLEPGLSSCVAGGFLLPDERSVRPEQLTAALAAAILRLGGSIVSQTAVTGARIDAGVVRELSTSAGALECDAALIAAGAWSGDVAKLFGVSIPIEAGKGYSITVQTTQPAITRPIDLFETKVACTPFDGALRLAGTMELSGQNLRLEPSRVAAIRRAGDTYFNDWRGEGQEQVWVGMRPLTPDGLPVIGSLPGVANAFVATGHAMLGVTLAPATARAITGVMHSDTVGMTMSPFRAERFDRRHRKASVTAASA